MTSERPRSRSTARDGFTLTYLRCDGAFLYAHFLRHSAFRWRRKSLEGKDDTKRKAEEGREGGGQGVREGGVNERNFYKMEGKTAGHLVLIY